MALRLILIFEPVLAELAGILFFELVIPITLDD